MSKHNKISFTAAVLMSVNIILGAGIFMGPQNMAAVAGTFSFLGWGLTGLLLFPIIWSIAQASKVFPGAGGFYNYCATGINPTAGFIAHWTYLLGYMGTTATLTTVLREGIIKNMNITFVAQHPHIFNILVIVTFSLLNLINIKLISRLQSGGTILKMLPLLFAIVVMGFYWNPAVSYPLSQLSSLGLTIPFAIFAFWGFEACCSIGHLLEGGPKQVGKVIITAFFITTLLYTLFHIGLIYIMGIDNLTKYGAEAFPLFMGLSSSTALLVSVGITGSILLIYCNSIFGMTLTNITNMYTLAHKKLIVGSKTLEKTNKNDRPIIAIVVHAIIIITLLFFVRERRVLVALTNMGICLAFVLTLLALFITHLKNKSYLQVFITLLGFASCSLLIYYSWVAISTDPIARIIYVTPLIGGIIAGLILYKFRQKEQPISPQPVPPLVS